MEKSFRQLLKEYFHFSKKDRRGVILLGTLIFLVISAIFLVDGLQLKSDYDFSEFKKALHDWEQEENTVTSNYSLFNFNPNTISEQQIDSLQLPRFVKNNLLNYRKAGGKFKRPEDIRKIYGMNDSIYAIIEKYIIIPQRENSEEAFRETKNIRIASTPKNFSGTFDPNSADSALLSEVGFNSFQAANLLKYRLSGGFFKTNSDLLKIYGVDSAFYLLIEKNIQIESSDRIADDISDKRSIQSEINIEINTADSLDLIRLPGVGSVFASRIIRYRQLLGGYYSAEQLLEVYNFPEETYSEIHQNISVDFEQIKQIRLNFAGYGELIRHPYIKKEQVKAILDYRNKNGSFRNIKELEDAGIIEAEKVKELKPYLTCR